jgi:hypothetical protein
MKNSSLKIRHCVQDNKLQVNNQGYISVFSVPPWQKYMSSYLQFTSAKVNFPAS